MSILKLWTSKKIYTWVKKDKYGLAGYSYTLEISKIFKSTECAKTLELAMEIGMHRFFMLKMTDYDQFDILFKKAIHLISKIDCVLKNDLLTRSFNAMDSKKKIIKRSFNIRYLAYAFVFFEADSEYTMMFLKEFMFSGMDNSSLADTRDMLELLTTTHVADPTDFEWLLSSIVHMLDFGGYKFFLNMIYFCNELPDDDSIRRFIEYYEITAKRVYFEYQFEALDLDGISSDEEEA